MVRKITSNFNNAELSFKIYGEGSDDAKKSFLEQDIMADLDTMTAKPEVVEITDIKVDSNNRRKGAGSSLIKDLIRNHRDSVIIAAAGLPIQEFEEEPTNEQYRDHLELLHKFYTKCGFISINKYYGGYETKHVYAYSNRALMGFLRENTGAEVMLEGKITKISGIDLEYLYPKLNYFNITKDWSHPYEGAPLMRRPNMKED